MCLARFLHIYIFTFIFGFLQLQKIPRPTGVSLEKSYLYVNRDDNFYCLSDGYRLPYNCLNDNYCDCKDGSDEPGTSACNNGIFYCENKGFVNKTLYSSMVNDGICDCCDGSDEYRYGHCTNTCEEEGKIYVENLKQEILRTQAGLKIKEEYVKRAENLKSERNNKLFELVSKKDNIKHQLSKISSIKTELELKEKAIKEDYQNKLKDLKEKIHQEENFKKSAQVYKWLDKGETGLIDIETIKQNMGPKLILEHSKLPNNDSEERVNYFQTCDKNSDEVVDQNDINAIFSNLAKLQYDKEEFYEHISQPLYQCHPELYETFYKEITNLTPDMNNEPVTESTPSSTEPQIPSPHTNTEGMAHIPPPPTTDDDYTDDEHDEIQKETEHENVVEEDDDEETDNEDEEDDLYPRDRKHENVRNKKQAPSTTNSETFEGEEPDILPYDEATKNFLREKAKVIEEFDKITRESSDMEREMNEIQKKLERDYGPEAEYAVLQDETFEFKDQNGEYTYRMIPFSRTEQDSGSSATNIGRWGNFEPDERTGDKYGYMLFTDGQQCWNGPKRRTKVKLFCGDENKIISISEPSRCEYYMEFTTPAKCVPIEQRHDLKPYLKYFKDEL